MGDARFDRLSDGQKECLRLFHARWEIKDIARQIGRSPVTVNQRLSAARRHLGVDRSAEAARLLVEHEGQTYTRPIYEPNQVGSDSVEPDTTSHGGNWYSDIPMPFPTRERPDNDLTFQGKIVYALVLAAVVALIFGGATAALSGLSDIL